uniref:Endoplasmic reticulum transmembrane protein n=1 Tax=Gopherus agassizii TaxID=38772 RepID=A0A452I6N4_9SAUR
MTFQWTAVASFLYAEIGVILLLCVPFISPLRWQKIFMIPLWNKIANYWNKAFLTIIVLLIVLFLDAIREVKKYSTAHGTEKAANINPNAYDHIQMKLFRSQRNLYISGFSLFLWLVSNTGSNKKIGKLDGQIYKKGLKELNMDSLAKIVSMLKVETNC